MTWKFKVELLCDGYQRQAHSRNTKKICKQKAQLAECKFHIRNENAFQTSANNGELLRSAIPV